MIAADQPTCFPSNVSVHVSSREDGTMLDRTLASRHDERIVANRQKFCDQVDSSFADCVYQIISYTGDMQFDMIREVVEPNVEGVFADVLYTETPGVGLFLPIADCVGTVIYDPVRRAIALAHLGRHASIAKTMRKTIEFFARKGSVPRDLVVWMAPSVSKDSYAMEYFDHADDADWRAFAVVREGKIYLDLAGFNARLAVQAGVLAQNIYRSSIDTATDEHYFSHFRGDTTGRFAVLAMMKK